MVIDDAKRATAIGPALGRLLDITRDAGLPALIVGRHGIGKSEYLERWATDRGMRPFVLDLSLLEATDLTGIPFVAEGITRFAPITSSSTTCRRRRISPRPRLATPSRGRSRVR